MSLWQDIKEWGELFGMIGIIVAGLAGVGILLMLINPWFWMALIAWMIAT